MSERDPAKIVAERFTQRFGHPPPHLAYAPGRVNLIGEHTDYNDGFVLPMALGLGVHIAFEPTDDDRVVVCAIDCEEEAAFSCAELAPDSDAASPGHWSLYVKGVAWALREKGHALRGWRGAFAGNVPIGAGLSSSAALEIAAGRAFCASSGVPFDAREVALAGQQAEHRWAQVKCGIMDQIACAAGRPGSALLLDCRSLEFEQIPLPVSVEVVTLDSGTRRGLVDSEYNARRSECEAAAHHFAVPALRNLDTASFEARAHELDRIVAKRARHVVTENARTLDAAEALRRGDTARLGALMQESHASLRDSFDVSTPALDALVECAMADSACLGARMTGAGFGGCVVALTQGGQTERFVANLVESYARETGRRLVAYA